MKIAFHPSFAHSLPEGHRFPMLKYELIPEQLLHQGIIKSSDLFEPGICADEVVLLTHSHDYLKKLHEQTLTPREQRQIGFPQSPELTERELRITQGTIDCCHYAMKDGVSMNVAGGTHHAFRDHGEGFCLLNDFAVAANYLLDRKLAHRILVTDLDVHQGNGTASIFKSNNRVFTFSMHGKHNYPFRKEKSDLDIELEDGTEDDLYLRLLRENLERVMEIFHPDFCFFQSGVDVLATDKFGKLNVSLEGCRLRDRYVFNAMRKAGVPVVVAMGGGYSPDIRNIVDAHCNTFKEALGSVIF